MKSSADCRGHRMTMVLFFPGARITTDCETQSCMYIEPKGQGTENFSLDAFRTNERGVGATGGMSEKPYSAMCKLGAKCGCISIFYECILSRPATYSSPPNLEREIYIYFESTSETVSGLCRSPDRKFLQKSTLATQTLFLCLDPIWLLAGR